MKNNLYIQRQLVIVCPLSVLTTVDTLEKILGIIVTFKLKTCNHDNGVDKASFKITSEWTWIFKWQCWLLPKQLYSSAILFPYWQQYDKLNIERCSQDSIFIAADIIIFSTITGSTVTGKSRPNLKKKVLAFSYFRLNMFLERMLTDSSPKCFEWTRNRFDSVIFHYCNVIIFILQCNC